MGLCKASAAFHSYGHGALHIVKSRNSMVVLPTFPASQGGLFVTRAVGSKGTNDGDEGPPGGDKKVQDALVQMARIETQKVRVTEFVDEKAKRLTEIARQADEEYARIAADASKGLAAASDRMMEELEAGTQAFEEELASARAEMEAQEKELDRFEKAVEDARSEGLFFKSLYRSKPAPEWADRSEEERQSIAAKVKAIDATAKQEAGSQGRRVAYGGLAVVIGAAIVQGLLSPDEGNVRWPQLGVYGAIEVFLILQLLFEGGQMEDDNVKPK